MGVPDTQIFDLHIGRAAPGSVFTPFRLVASRRPEQALRIPHAMTAKISAPHFQQRTVFSNYACL